MVLVTTSPPVPPLSPADRGRASLLFQFVRLQVPGIRLPEPAFLAHLDRSFRIFLPKNPAPVPWSAFLEGLYAVDWAVCVGCLEGQNPAWEMLFAARTGRSDCLLVDALRARAVRLYPRDEERQETAVTEFWSNLIAPESEESLPVLARYDGQRPLAPWLIRVFQNWHLSKLRQSSGVTALPDDDFAVPMEPARESDSAGRWHEVFRQAARDWLGSIDDEERLLLGLRWRYRMSQREAAKLFGLNEGTLTRRTDKLRDRALEQIGGRLVAEGWTGDDLEGFILTELGAILTDDPRLSADNLGRILAAKGKTLPE
jgi:RNA polymerase sigma factor (sigma-70 family)